MASLSLALALAVVLVLRARSHFPVYCVCMKSHILYFYFYFKPDQAVVVAGVLELNLEDHQSRSRVDCRLQLSVWAVQVTPSVPRAFPGK